jgi:quercetin dioxygenase-like cupin family protein
MAPQVHQPKVPCVRVHWRQSFDWEMMLDSTAHVVDWNMVERAFPYEGITRQTVISADATLTRYTYAPGCVFPVHQHPDAQITVVHSGVIEFDVAGKRVVLRAGQVALIPGGVPHGARVTGDATVVTDNYFASARRAPLDVVGE